MCTFPRTTQNLFDTSGTNPACNSSRTFKLTIVHAAFLYLSLLLSAGKLFALLMPALTSEVTEKGCMGKQKVIPPPCRKKQPESSLTLSQSWASQCTGQFLSPQGCIASGLVSMLHWDSGTTRPSLVLQYTCRIILPCPQPPLHWKRNSKREQEGECIYRFPLKQSLKLEVFQIVKQILIILGQKKG